MHNPLRDHHHWYNFNNLGQEMGRLFSYILLLLIYKKALHLLQLTISQVDLFYSYCYKLVLVIWLPGIWMDVSLESTKLYHIFISIIFLFLNLYIKDLCNVCQRTHNKYQVLWFWGYFY